MKSDTLPSPPVPKKEKPYEAICISLYHEDVRRIDRHVSRLRELGFSRANRSMLIRYMLRKLDPDDVTEDELYLGSNRP